MPCGLQPWVWTPPKSGCLEPHWLLRWQGQSPSMGFAYKKPRDGSTVFRSGSSGMSSGSVPPSTSGSASLGWPPSKGTPAPLVSLLPSSSSAAEENCLLTKFHPKSFPGGSDGKKSALQCGRPEFYPWIGKMLWRREWQPTPVFLPGKSHGQRSLAHVGQSMGPQKVDTTKGLIPSHISCSPSSSHKSMQTMAKQASS